MSRRRKQRRRGGASKAEERESARRAERRDRRRRTLGYVAAITAIIVVVAALWATTPPNYMGCFPPGTAMSERSATMVYIGIGNASDYKFVRIPENVGQGSTSCTWPIQTFGNTPGERTTHYANVHTVSPYTHTYTLADFFYVWGEGGGYGAPIYFHADGVSSYRGRVSVYIYHEEYPAAENLWTNASYLWAGDVRAVPLADAQWVYIWLQAPYTNTTTSTG